MIGNSLFNKEAISSQLAKLHPDAIPKWGTMTAQHMVEHLAGSIAFSNGKKPMNLAIPREKAERVKARLSEPEWTMPREFKVAFLPENSLPPLHFSSIETATDALFSEIDDFYSFFALNPDATPTHPYFSELNRMEWELLHHKHFLHHFEQFGLI